MNTKATPNDAIIGTLRTAFSESDGIATVRLRSKLTSEAQRDGLLDVTYRTVDSPIGSLLLTATEVGLVRVAFECEDHDAVLTDLAQMISPRIMFSSGRFDSVCRQLDEYFDRARDRFDLPVDFRLAKGFRRDVLGQLAEIPYGRTASYGDLARLAGKPAAIRAAASACSHNPLPIVIPCHRIIKSDGTIGKYLGGVEAKQLLLTLEQPTNRR